MKAHNDECFEGVSRGTMGSEKRGPISASLADEGMPITLPIEGNIDIWKIDEQIQEQVCEMA